MNSAAYSLLLRLYSALCPQLLIWALVQRRKGCMIVISGIQYWAWGGKTLLKELLISGPSKAR